MTDTEFQRNATVVLFDGPCTLCNKSVDWIHSRDFYDRTAIPHRQLSMDPTPPYL